MNLSLKTYKKKRNFKISKEPLAAKPIKIKKNPIFVIQKHNATHLHYDFRIEINRVLKSWAVPKNIPKTSNIKRLAILTENHPMKYAKFEGVIPKGNYGAGTVKIVDSGTFENIKKDNQGKIIPIAKCFKLGQIEIHLKGKKINARYALIRFKNDKNWLIIKMKKK
jgi:DNA ligase D-like protein (predicted 3'-phosphoesterase)